MLEADMNYGDQEENQGEDGHNNGVESAVQTNM